MTTNVINWWPTPAEIPDLNPNENIWGSKKEFFQRHYKPPGLKELKSGIRFLEETYFSDYVQNT